jgi:Flp pilus assembly protein CpaB
MRRGGRILLYLVLVILLVGGGAFAFLMSRGSTSQPPTPTPAPIKVLVLRQPVALADEITEEVLGTVDLPPEFANNPVLILESQRDEVLGQLAKYPLGQGIFLTRSMLASTAEELDRPGSDSAKLIPRGMTAIAIPITRLSSAAYAIRDGDHVDVIATMLFVDVDPGFQSMLPNMVGSITGTGYIEGQLPALTATVGGASGMQGRADLDPALNQAFYLLPSEAQRPRLVSQRILQSVEVLRIGTFELPSELAGREPSLAEQAGPATPTPTGGARPAPRGPDIITLIVTPQEAITLTYLIYSNAQLTLTLRSKGDLERLDTESATLQYLIGQYNISLPAKLPYAIQPALEELVPPVMPNDSVIINP